jgi:hypothetical protein
MPDQPTGDDRNELIRAALVEAGASSPTLDTDSLAAAIARALDVKPADLEVGTDTDAQHATGETGSASEHPDDVAHEGTAAEIAAGKVVEPPDGGVVKPTDG